MNKEYGDRIHRCTGCENCFAIVASGEVIRKCKITGQSITDKYFYCPKGSTYNKATTRK